MVLDLWRWTSLVLEIFKESITMRHLVCQYSAACLMVLVSSQSIALNVVSMPDTALAQDWVALDDPLLDTLRGGFDMGNGLRVSFGVMRSIAINGEQVSRTSFHVSDLKSITPDQARSASNAIGQVSLVQPEMSGASIVQNSLNNQHISSLTEINTTVNSMGLIKTMNASSTLQDALLGSVGVR